MQIANDSRRRSNIAHDENRSSTHSTYWSAILRDLVEKGPSPRALQPIAELLHSEAAFVLVPSSEREGEVWSVPSGWMYSRNGLNAAISFDNDEEPVSSGLRVGAVTLGGTISSEKATCLSKWGIDSLLAAAIVHEEERGLLVVCNSNRIELHGEWQLCYALADVNLAVATAMVLSAEGVARFGARMEQIENANKLSPSSSVWESERKELLETHPSWFVAYLDGKQVALSPNLEKLTQELVKKFGRHRRPCELRRIVGTYPSERGPSPRLAEEDGFWEVEP